MQGIAALTVFSATALLVAMLRNLRSLAWLTTAGGIGAAAATLIGSREALVVSVFLLLLGFGSLWLVYRRRGVGLQWLGAFGANVGVIALLVFTRSDQWTVEAGGAAIIAIVLLLGYLASFVLHSHVQGRNVSLFEPVQTIAAIGIAFWAVKNAAAVGQLSLQSVGVGTTVLGVLAYRLALTAETRRDRKHNFFYYSTLGLVLIITGTALTMPPIGAASVWCVMALTTAYASGRTGWVTLSLQCTFLLLAAGVASGLLGASLAALAGGATDVWPAFVPAHPGIALTTVACLFIPVAQKSDRWGTLAGLPQLAVLALSVWEVGGLFVEYVAPAVAGAGGPEPNAAVIAALRTAVLSVASVTLALSSRHRRWPEARWLVYPVLILVGVKLFAEDFPHGQPVTLFVALAFVGSALLLVARLLRNREIPA